MKDLSQKKIKSLPIKIKKLPFSKVCWILNNPVEQILELSKGKIAFYERTLKLDKEKVNNYLEKALDKFSK